MTGSRRILPTLAMGVLGLVGIQPGAIARQRSVAPDTAPPSWLAYAGKVRGLVVDWLRGPDEAAVRLRVYLDAQRPAADRPGAPLILKVWIGHKGAIERIDFAPFADAQPNMDLRNLLIGKVIGETAPKGMLQPLRLAVQLNPAPVDSSSATTQP